MTKHAHIFKIICLLSIWGTPCLAQNSGYAIRLTLSGNSTGKVALALQTTNNVVIIDSLPVLNGSSLLFLGNQSLTPGQYTFLQNNRRLFNFLISFERKVDLQFTAKVENGRTTELTAEGDAENSAYMEFQRFIQDANRNPNLTENDIRKIDRYTDSIARRFPNTLLAIIANNISTPPLPQYMALGDKRVLHTSILPVRLQSFFTNVVPPQPDLVIPQIDSILRRCTDPAVKEWCGEFLLGFFLSSNIMGMENAALHVAKKYLSSELKTSDNDLLFEIENYVSFNEHSLLGMNAPELLLPNAQGQFVSLNKLVADYTILLFYDEDCPICQEELPEIDKVYKQYKAKNVRVYAVYTQDRFEAWRRYAQTLNPEWIQVWDPDFTSGFHKLYNVTGTPKIYLLDRNKKIIGRGIDADVLQQILSYHLD